MKNLVILLLILMTILGCSKSTSTDNPEKIPTPVLLPASGAYLGPKTITIGCALDDVQIYYTLDGSTPTTQSTLFTTPFQLTEDKTIKAFAVKEGYLSSDVVTGQYTITMQQVETPVVTPESGIYYQEKTIQITCDTENAQIHYTLDGTEPNESSLLYSAPFVLNSSKTLKVKAFKTDFTPSLTVEKNYQIFVSEIPGFLKVVGGSFSNGTGMITLTNYHISVYEITQLEWFNTMGNHPGSSNGIGDNYPVYNVSWYDVIKYCNKRSAAEGLSSCYTYDIYGIDSNTWPDTLDHEKMVCNWEANGYRLPTEMEWLYAAMGGNQTQAYTYSGSNDIGSVAWYNNNSSAQTHPVGQKSNNELGLKDMTGNVLEWCWDIYDDYESGNITNPTGPATGTQRIYRGGCWFSNDIESRMDYRFRNFPTLTNPGIGFRVVRKGL